MRETRKTDRPGDQVEAQLRRANQKRTITLPNA